MDREHKIKSFEEIGMTNPFDTRRSIERSKTEVKLFDFYTEVYPKYIFGAIIEAIKNKEPVKPPKCVFVPSKDVMRSMIKALVKYGKRDSREMFLLRFGLIDE